MERSRLSPPHLPASSSDLSDQTPSTSSTLTPSSIPILGGNKTHKYESLAGEEQEEEDISYRGAAEESSPRIKDTSVHGLNIKFPDHNPNRFSLPTKIEQVSPEPQEYGKGRGDSMLTPNPVRFSKHQSYQSLGGGRVADSPYPDEGYSFTRSSPQSLYSPYTYDDNESTRRMRASATFSLDPTRALDEMKCESRDKLQTSRGSWLSITILVLALYSTIFSALWLGIAVAKPTWKTISKDKFSPSTASLLFTAFAKSIELSFVTVFVAALGQVLSHTAIRKGSKGITVADMLLRQWIQQPGSLITHWEAIRFSALTLTGMLTLTATLISMLYTTASDGLVAPKPLMGNFENRMLVGQVKSIFANNTYQIQHCKSPISESEDPWNAGANCMEIEHSGQAYHNFMQYLPMWAGFTNSTRDGSTRMADRPPPVGMLWDNTTVTGSWILEESVEQQSDLLNRTINNVTLAMPLASVVGAAKAKNNSILQPQDYNVRASLSLPYT